ncbi:hypothetical protein HDU76_008185, partial [Blyttiomyces sp. JEL0837]
MITITRSSSCWDYLPAEIRLDILRQTNLLTRYLNHLITDDEILQLAIQLWMEVFSSDWPGDLKLLPLNLLPTLSTGLCHLQSKTLYTRLCEARPDISTSNSSTVTDNIIKEFFEDDERCGWVGKSPKVAVGKWIERIKELSEAIHSYLIHIPMRHGWLSNIPKWMYQNDEDKLKLIPIASYNGHALLLKYLLQKVEFGYSLKLASRLAFRCAVENNQPITLRILIMEGLISIQSKYHAFKTSAVEGKVEIMRVVLETSDIDASTYDNYALRVACELGHTNVVELLLRNPMVDAGACDDEPIRDASANGHADVVRLLLTEPNVDPSTHDNQPIISTAEKGHVNVVSVLAGDPRVDPTARNNCPIMVASAEGHLEVVRFLLSLPGVDPTAGNNKCIRSASQNGHYNIVKLLLDIPAVDPAAENNYAIRNACANGHVEIVKLLLSTKHRGIDLSANDNEAIKVSCQNGHSEIVQLLASVPSVIRRGLNNEVLLQACQNNYTETVGILASVPTAQQGDLNNVLIQACQKGYTEAVQLLLSVPIVDPTVSLNEPLRQAFKNGHPEIVKLLLKVPAVRATSDLPTMFTQAYYLRYLDVIPSILSVPGVPKHLFIEHLHKAYSTGNNDLVRALMHSPVYAQTVGYNGFATNLFKMACWNWEPAVVEEFLKAPYVDPRWEDSYAIRTASEKGHLSIVKWLLEDGRADPGANSNFSLRISLLTGSLNVAMLLLADTRVDP